MRQIVFSSQRVAHLIAASLAAALSSAGAVLLFGADAADLLLGPDGAAQAGIALGERV